MQIFEKKIKKIEKLEILRVKEFSGISDKKKIMVEKNNP